MYEGSLSTKTFVFSTGETCLTIPERKVKNSKSVTTIKTNPIIGLNCGMVRVALECFF